MMQESEKKRLFAFAASGMARFFDAVMLFCAIPLFCPGPMNYVNACNNGNRSQDVRRQRNLKKNSHRRHPGGVRTKA